MFTPAPFFCVLCSFRYRYGTAVVDFRNCNAESVHRVLAVTIRAQRLEPRAHVSVCAAISSNGPPRKDFVLERGVVGTSPPLIRGTAFLTSEEVERLLIARDREVRYGIERGSVREGMIGVQASTL